VVRAAHQGVGVLGIEPGGRQCMHQRTPDRIRTRVHLEAMLAEMHVGEKRMRGRGQGIEFHRPLEQIACLRAGLGAECPGVAARAEHAIVGAEFVRVLAQRALQRDVLYLDAKGGL
jgi:hypothetical protein